MYDKNGIISENFRLVMKWGKDFKRQNIKLTEKESELQKMDSLFINKLNNENEEAFIEVQLDEVKCKIGNYESSVNAVFDELTTFIPSKICSIRFAPVKAFERSREKILID